MARRALILSENAPVPADRRVWNEARTLTAAGWQVVIVCAQGQGRHDAPYELLEGIEIHRFPLEPATGGIAGYAREYGQAMWRMRKLVRRLAREQRFDVVHGCNPPDFLLLAARSLRRDGTRFVFDHHDLVPELYRSKFGGGKSPMYRVALALEQVPYRLADVAISTNESYRQVAVGRGRMAPQDVFVVRNGPDLVRFRPDEPDPSLKRGRRHLIAYLGIMGAQDGIDHAVRALGELRERDDWHATFVGTGDVVEDMKALAAQLGIGDRVEFAGWKGDDDIRRIISTADVCLAPDPPSPLNDVSTMIKIPEYMAMGRAIASYDLPESRFSAQDAAAYAATPTPESLAGVVRELLDDPGRRARMGAAGRERVDRELAWQHAEHSLLAAYDHALAAPAPRPAGVRATVAHNET
jgi:glycosyltransferase involved in cell wall biosynthesis